MLKSFESHSFTLSNFQGPLDFLLYLAQKKEVDLTRIFIKKIIEEYLTVLKERQVLSIDAGGEFLSLTSYLLYLKSQALLPQEKQELDPDELDPKFDIIHQLLDYCEFKDAAKSLSQREREQQAYFFRGGVQKEIRDKRGKGLKYLELEKLADVFSDLLKKATHRTGDIEDEAFLVADKIEHLKALMENASMIPLEELFQPTMCKDELIVSFLAMLELMKYQFLYAVQCQENRQIFLKKKEEEVL